MHFDLSGKQTQLQDEIIVLAQRELFVVEEAWGQRREDRRTAVQVRASDEFEV